jgi:hypothetical protein
MSEPAKPKAPAGWYKHPSMVNTQRYWDGQAWTDHVAPGDPTPATPVHGTRPCPYCRTPIHQEARRCQACAGDLRYCSNCKANVGMTSKQKFVGIVRGGTKTQYRCMKLRQGPRRSPLLTEPAGRREACHISLRPAEVPGRVFLGYGAVDLRDISDRTGRRATCWDGSPISGSSCL